MDVERLNRATALRDTGQLEEALHEFTGLESVAHEPGERASLLLNVSGVLTQMGRFDEAHRQADRAAALDSEPETLCHALVAHSDAYSLAEKKDSALAELDRALGKYPDILESEQYRYLYEEIQTRRGLLLVRLNRFQDAASILEQCASFDLDEYDRTKVLYNLGRCYFDLKNPSRAKQEFLKFLEAGGDAAYVASAHFLLGTIYYNEGADSKALMEFEWLLPRMAEVRWPGSVLYTWLAKTHKALGNKAEAERYAALAKNSDD